jgi:hypothetical protein
MIEGDGIANLTPQAQIHPISQANSRQSTD